MIRLDPQHRLVTSGCIPRALLWPWAGVRAVARAALLASFLLALPMPAAAPTSTRPAPMRREAPVAAVQPMAARPAARQLPSAARSATAPRPSSPAPKIRPLPDPHLALFEPAGCRVPPVEYGLVRAGVRMLSARTVAMLDYAAELYGGPLDIVDQAILPSPRGRAGEAGREPEGENGIVDLAVVSGSNGRVLYEQIDPLIRALRAAGFAAWLRDRGELSPRSEAYVHAVAIGDRQLSAEARAQLTGPDGYFLGGQGLHATLSPDRHGGPVLCRWMRDPSLADPRAAPSGAAPSAAGQRWEDRLVAAAQGFITTDYQATGELARSLGFLASDQEDPSNICGPLSAAILREAGLLPASVGPVSVLKNYWLANPVTNGRPWSLFPADQYKVHRFSTGIDRFDFRSWPLRPGDFVYTYSGRGSFSHMFVVTEIDPEGRAYTVTNQLQRDGEYLVQRVLLYDPQDDQAGVLKSRCSECGSWRRRTGLGGFDVLRRREFGLAAGAELVHTVVPGETLPQIASAHGSSVVALVERNQIPNPLALQVGAQLQVAVGALRTERDSPPPAHSAPPGLGSSRPIALAQVSAGDGSADPGR